MTTGGGDTSELQPGASVRGAGWFTDGLEREELEPELLELPDHAEQVRLIHDPSGQHCSLVRPLHPHLSEQEPEAIVELAANDELVLPSGSVFATHLLEVRAGIGEASRMSPR